MRFLSQGSNQSLMDDYDFTRLVERRNHVTCEDFLSLDQVAQFLRALVVQVQTGLLVSFNDSSVRHDLLHRFDPVLDDFRLHALRCSAAKFLFCGTIFMMYIRFLILVFEEAQIVHSRKLFTTNAIL